jgi:hypothetical protein
MGAHGIAALLLATSVGAGANLLQNADFEKGAEGWSSGHTWYEQPKGAGLSAVQAVPGEGRDGSVALRLEGRANRGLVMQVFAAYPGRYLVSGWLRVEGLEGASASVLCEWMDAKGTWMRGDTAGTATGTTEWIHFETEVEAPPGTRLVHLDLLTSGANSGRAWFDDVAMVRRPGSGLPPAVPVVTGSPGPGAGGLTVRWDPAALAPGAVRLLLRCRAGDAAPGLPRTVVDPSAGEAVLNGLEPNREVRFSGLVVDADGLASGWSAEVTARTGTTQVPRAGLARAESAAAGAVTLSWWPHPLSREVKAVRAGVVAAGGGLQVLAESPVPAADTGPFYRTAPWVQVAVAVPAGTAALCFQAVGVDGQLSDVGTATVVRGPDSVAELAGVVRFAAATANLPQQGELPAATQVPELTLMRGQAKGFQIVCRPAADWHRVRLEPGDLRAEVGDGSIPAHWLAWHAVRYVNVEKNSRATPLEGLVWPGPGLYPDELDDAPEVDLPAALTNTFFVRVTAPRSAPAGWYRGTLRLGSQEGALQIPLRVRVAETVLPAVPRVDFVYWFDWNDACRPFGVAPGSEDSWQVLAGVADLMRAYRQNAVVVPWSLARFWRLPDGRTEADFTDFDRFVTTFAERGVDKLFCLSHMGGRSSGEWECPTMAASSATVVQVATGAAEPVAVVSLLPLIESHLRARGWLERFAVHVADEPIPVNLESYRTLARRVQAAAPGLRRIDAIHVPDLVGDLEIWVPQLNYLKQWHPEYRKAQAAGATLWFYVAWVPQGTFPNRMIDGPAIKSRLLHWMHAVYGTEGYLHWALNRWSIPLTSLESPGDQYICWPSERFIADSSLRYEAEREGLEDAELMLSVRAALEARGRSRQAAAERVRELIRPAVRDAEDLTLDWDVLEAVRLRLLEELTQP